MTGGTGLTRIITDTLGTDSYRYTLYDDNGDLITEPEARASRDAVNNEWERDGATLEYRGSFLSFGPSDSGWTVDHVRVEVDRGDGYEYLGAATTGGGSVNVASGEKLIIGEGADTFSIDYSAGSDDPSNMPSDLTALWNMVIDFHENERPRWLFRLMNNGGYAHDSVAVSGSNVEWEKITNGIRYQGNAFEWSTVETGFTAESIDVLYFPDPDSFSTVLLASVPDTTSFNNNTRVSVSSGDLDITDA